MTIAESFLAEYDAEMASTRKLLERLPAGRLDWKPHAKSRSLGELAIHVTELPRWGLRFRGEEFRVGSEKAPALRDAGEFVRRFDENVAAAREGIARMSDEGMEEDFTVRKPDGAVFFTLSRRGVVRRLILNHLIHHRGQLTVYLRLQDVPLPSVYGPTADEAV